MSTTNRFQQTWPYVRNVLLFFVVVPPAIVLTATTSQLMGQFIPVSYIDFFADEAEQAYLIAAFIGLPLSIIHTYVLRHAQTDSRPPSGWRSIWYLILLSFLATLSLLRFLPLGYDAMFYIVPGVLCYGAAVCWLGVAALQDLPRDHLRLPPRPSLRRYLLNAVLFVITAIVVIAAGIWIGLKTGLVKGLWIAAPIFLFSLAVYLSILHTFLLWELSTTGPKTFQIRSVGLAGGLALLASVVYILFGNLEFTLLLVTALIYGWVVGHLWSKAKTGVGS